MVNDEWKPEDNEMESRTSELKKIEQQLKEEQRDAEQELQTLDQQVTEFGETAELAEGADNHPGDDSDRISEQERMFTIRRQLAERKADIDHALGKLEEGVFGICERCGKEIPTGRLEVLPFARYCVECQEIVDREGVAAT